MQKALASHQFTQFAGRLSPLLTAGVQVAYFGSHARLPSVGATLASSAVCQPCS
jgi:hypothetical protein